MSRVYLTAEQVPQPASPPDPIVFGDWRRGTACGPPDDRLGEREPA